MHAHAWTISLIRRTHKPSSAFHFSAHDGNQLIRTEAFEEIKAHKTLEACEIVDTITAFEIGEITETESKTSIRIRTLPRNRPDAAIEPIDR